MGGQGKSQIGLEYCRQSRSTYSDIFWVNASSEMMAVKLLVRLALEIGQTLAGAGDFGTKVRLVVHALAQRSERWLMLLDKYDDLDHFSSIGQLIPARE
jgi:hypothetical protein